MHWLFISLLITNLLHLGWMLHQPSIRNSPTRIEIPKNAKQLVFLNEPIVQQTTKKKMFLTELLKNLPDIKQSELENRLLKMTYHCFSIGPIHNENELDNIYQWFHAKNLPTKNRVLKVEGKKLFWIYLSERAPEEDTKKTIENLNSLGIRGVGLIDTNEFKNVISLGLYQTQAEVNQRLIEVRGIGYEPIVFPFYNHRKELWLDVGIDIESDTAIDIFTKLQLGRPPPAIDCKNIAP